MIRVIHVAECIGGVDRYLRCLLKYSDKEKIENIMILSQLYKKEDYEGLADHVEIMHMTHGMNNFTHFVVQHAPVQVFCITRYK